MSAQRPLTGLEERKSLLIVQAALHRAALRAEWVNARARLDWLNEARNKVHAAGPWLAVGAAAAGLLAASRWRKLARWIPAALAGWRWVRKFKAG